MSVDLRSHESYPHILTFTVSTTLTEIQLGNVPKFITIQSTKKLYVTTTGTDGGAVGSDKFEIPADNALELKLSEGYRANRSIFLATDSSTSAVNLLLER